MTEELAVEALTVGLFLIIILVPILIGVICLVLAIRFIKKYL